ncbi:hypothetical protein [Acinetobacter sp. ANC 4648]|uniref:hypothetical protein n=1 Tax=Acinetobacter sp. ANC 4648 TaxID=1977875 RepID=UPI000A33F4D2|nr:hypothetical protein [Acinetobacter sp. ANC 4648]OTG84703.1 hypothetical protein B9T27_00300 [Acinetobacter sp. ANC 4648]
MKSMTKIALITASIISIGGLTACQSSTTSKDNYGSPMMGQHKGDRHISPEQREQMQQMRAQHKMMREQIKKACDGKTVGETVQINAGDKTLNGTCSIVFKADRKAMHEMKHELRHDQSRMMYGHRGEKRMQEMTTEQRAEMKQQFEQKRAERQAKWEAIQQACVGKSNGQAIQVKMGEKTINGTCVVRFKVQKPTENLQSKQIPMMNIDKAS